MDNRIYRALRLGAAMTTATILAACGGGGGGGGGGPATQAGVFFDSPVAGLAYTSGSRSGFTGPDGSYTCEVGQPLTFSIGGLQIPAGTCATGTAVVTPLTVFATTDVSDVRVVNLARLLQTLDKNGNPDDGINIDANVHTNAANLPSNLDFSSDSVTFGAAVGTFINDVSTAGLTSNSSLVSAATAQAHLQGQLTSIAGPWHFITGSGGNVLITFFADGSYVHAEDGTVDPSGQNGMERGTYTWNSGTGAFTTTCPTVDTNGEWGLSHPNPPTCTGSTATVSVNGNTLTINAVTGSVELTRVADATNPIIGAWSFTAGSQNVLITFFADGSYVHAEDGTVDPSGQNGMERGTYTWNSGTGAFTTTCPTVDTNGEWGLSHPNPQTCTGSTATVMVSGNTLTIDDGSGNPMQWDRVIP